MPGSTVTIIPGCNGTILIGRQPRGFMDLQAQPMPKPVAELFAKSRLGDDVSCDLVNRLAGHSGTDRPDRLHLCFQHNVVDLSRVSPGVYR